MSLRICPAIASLALAAAVVLPLPALGQTAGWHSNLNRAAEVATKTGKPIFVVFRCER
ncbi:MAG: hypothetical protein IT428_02470 [Planctomycetaceae bacterium]|nr:hypothetical protein [Planctomycetaceae bacterium]